MCIKFDEPKIHHAKKSRRFIQKKVHQKREKIHQAQKCASTSRQESSLESASKWLKLRKTKKAKDPQKFIQSSDDRHRNRKKECSLGWKPKWAVYAKAKAKKKKAC